MAAPPASPSAAPRLRVGAATVGAVAALLVAAVGAGAASAAPGGPAGPAAPGVPARMAALATVPAEGGVRPAAVPSTGPVFAGDFPDPDVIAVGGAYWGYSTGSAGRNIQVIGSPDLVNWVGPVDALPTLPAWAVAGMTWAPGVVQLPSGFVMYYTVHDGSSGRQCLSVATSSSPAGPFVDHSQGPFVCQLADGGSIDPSAFVAPDGRLYLVWKSDDNAIGKSPVLWSQLLSADGLSLVGSPSPLLTQTAAWQVPTVEGPAMFALAGRYYLFYGANLWNTTSAGIGYAVCTSPSGPCTDQSLSGPWLGTYGPLVGPSGPAPFHDAFGGTHLAFHGWNGPVGYVNGGVRSLWVDSLGFAAGYRVTSRDGGVFAYGSATYLGSASASHLNAPIVAMAESPDGTGYWQVGADGGVFAFGTAPFVGSTGALHLVAPVVGVMPSSTGRGYALVARDGGLFAFGDFPFVGSDGGSRSFVPVVGAATSPLLDGAGYWMARADGHVDAFGGAPALGSITGPHATVVAIVASPGGIGYWLVASDGSVYAFGSARYFGAPAPTPGAAPFVGMVATPTGSGYWLVDAGGGVFTFGDAGFAGSLGAVKLVAPVVGATGGPAGSPCFC
jgi:hypothetical protein